VPRIKLTEKTISRLRAPAPSGKQTIHWDAELRGFGVLCSGKTNARSFIAQRDLPSGRSRRVTIASTNELSLVAAKEQAKGLLVDMRRGLDPKTAKRGDTTLSSALDGYLLANKHLRERSRLDYRRTIEHHLSAWLDRPLRELTREMVEERHRAIAEEVADGGRYSGHATANSAMRALRAVFNHAIDRDATIGPNPVRLRREWFPVSRRERLVKADQLPAFHAAVLALPSAVARDYLLILLFTGLRRGEAASLTWHDIDFSERAIRIGAARTKAGRKLDLPMTDYVRDLLVARRALGDAGGWVFPANSLSGHIEEPKFPLARVFASTGIKISVHDLRRTFITIAESTDISPLALKALVNHALGNDVTSGYVQITVERLREPAQKVADRIKQLCGIAAVEGVVSIR
jgi:integrase